MVQANQARKAASGAANAQAAAAQQGISEEGRQFDAIQKLFAPYIQAGTGALGGQQALLGLSGPEAQKKAIDALMSGEQFKAMTQQGENAILQNASATGGLRGGNTQATLAQFRPQVLSQLIQSQFSNLGQIAGMGQASAAGQASAGMQQGQNIAGLLGQMGQAQAGGALAAGQANIYGTNALMSGLGSYGHSQGWKGF
jgi:hypothetical protein